MAFQISWFAVLIIIAVVIEAIVYFKTKSWMKVIYTLEILAFVALILVSLLLSETALMVAIDLLGIGLLVNGIVGLLGKGK